MKKHIKLLCLIIALSTYYFSNAQELKSDFTTKNMDYTTFINLVGKNNLEYSAEKFNMNIAEAQILSAKVFPDPEIEFGFADNGERRMNMGYGFSSELSWTLELGGKRKARINLAKNEKELTKFLLEDYFRNLRADATLAYLTTILKRRLLDVQFNSYQQVKKLSEADSIRFKLGSITQVDAQQSKLEAGIMLNDVFVAQADWKSSLVTLTLLAGNHQTDSLWNPQEDFAKTDQPYALQDLILKAQEHRSDLKAAFQNKRVSQSMVKLATASRALDLGLKIGMEYNSYARNIIAPTPSHTVVNLGVSIPIKFSNNRDGELKSAQYSVMQNEVLYKQAELAIQTEVIQAFYNYEAIQKQIIQFNTGLLTESKAILTGKIYSYQRGETSLLEFLDAQRTYNEMQHNYYQTLYDYAAAKVELERVAGIWNFNF